MIAAGGHITIVILQLHYEGMGAVLKSGDSQIQGALVDLCLVGHINTVNIDFDAVEVDARIVLSLSAGGGAVIVNGLEGQIAA